MELRADEVPASPIEKGLQSILQSTDGPPGLLFLVTPQNTIAWIGTPKNPEQREPSDGNVLQLSTTA